MKKLKYVILFVILVMTVGIAAVSSNLLINGSTPIASNPDDFNVYFSNVKVNGVQDLSLVTSETSLVFNGEFSAVGDKKEITYDVTNASKNYDANIDISCTQSTTYLTITNSFDTSSDLAATSTRTGVLTITLSKSYTGVDLTQDISCTINASAVERTSQGSGSVAGAVDPLYIGREIAIGEEKFNVISTTDDTVTMLAQYNVDDSYRQSKMPYYVPFSDEYGWDFQPGPKEIEIDIWSPYTYDLVYGYEEYLKEELNAEFVFANLITLRELQSLGCVIMEDYSLSYEDLERCYGDTYEWLINGQWWWTRSAYSADSSGVWFVMEDGTLLDCSPAADPFGVRPTVTISKETALSLIKYKMYDIGEEISIGDEKFNVISQTPTTVSMLAQYNLGTDYRQSSELNEVAFSEQSGWEYADYAYDIDIQQWSTIPKLYVNNYVDYLKSLTGYTSVDGDIVKLYELGKIGCFMQDNYYYSDDATCEVSLNYDWLLNSQSMWVASVLPYDGDFVWYMGSLGQLNACHFSAENGVRPVITVDKEELQ